MDYMGCDSCDNNLTGKESALYLKEYCAKRIKKYGLTTVRSGACKGCPYRYRGERKNMCCMFGNIPASWSTESIEKAYYN